MANILTSLKTMAEDAKKAVFAPQATATAPVVPQVLPQDKGYSPVDTMSSSSVSLIEARMNHVSQAIEEELQKDGRDFEKLHALVYNIIMLAMRNSVKADHEYIKEMTDQVKIHSIKIKDTYNTWSGMSVTVISATISIAGGVAGMAPFLPSSVIASDAAQQLARNAQNIGTAGTGGQSIGSLFNSKEEGKRGTYQIDLKYIESNKDHREEAKQSHNRTKETARAAHDQFMNMVHDTAKMVASAA